MHGKVQQAALEYKKVLSRNIVCQRRPDSGHWRRVGDSNPRCGVAA